MADGFLAADIPLQFSTVYYETQAPQSPLPEEFLHYQQKNRPIPQPGLQMALYVNLLFEPPNYAHLAQALTGRYKIFYLVCELDRLFERDLGLLSLADEIWTASEFCARTYRRYTSKPVYMIPHSIVVPPISGTRADFGLPEEGFLFLFSFAALSLEARKNARGLIQAFEMAFGPEPGKVKLIIKTLGLQAHDSALAEELRAALDQLGGIWIDEDYSNAQNWALMAACDAYISLHRAEGFGLTLAEAMALGKPVIATAYSGNLDFMTPENSYLVDYTLRPLQPEEIRQYRYVSSETPHWAEPDLAHAAEIMRQVVENPQAAQIKARRGQETIQQELNPASLQAKMLARLEQIPMNRPHQLLTDEIQQGQHERELAFHARVALFKLNQAYQAWHRIRMSAEALPQFLTKLNILAFPYRLWQRVRILGKLWAAQSDYDETLEQHLQALQITVYHLQDEVRVLQHELDHLKAEGRKKHD
jgi:glycosyltransferase involved in cell wall biosynthesis